MPVGYDPAVVERCIDRALVSLQVFIHVAGRFRAALTLRLCK
ncbi:hypothetical protein U769_14080 [Pseudomonas aeruginosa MTB-1]|nr:hypothetical protein U769_14080 [Pseudomonas aeruginosa MTB-1]